MYKQNNRNCRFPPPPPALSEAFKEKGAGHNSPAPSFLKPCFHSGRFAAHDRAVHHSLESVRILGPDFGIETARGLGDGRDILVVARQLVINLARAIDDQ